MLYMLLLYWDETTPSDDGQATIEKHFDFAAEARTRNAYVLSEALGGGRSATTLRTAGGKITTVDGPYIETKEAIGGFYVLDCADLDEALDYGRKIAGFSGSSVEIRPVVDVPGWDYGATADRRRHSMG